MQHSLGVLLPPVYRLITTQDKASKICFIIDVCVWKLQMMLLFLSECQLVSVFICCSSINHSKAAVCVCVLDSKQSKHTEHRVTKWLFYLLMGFSILVRNCQRTLQCSSCTTVTGSLSTALLLQTTSTSSADRSFCPSGSRSVTHTSNCDSTQQIMCFNSLNVCSVLNSSS